MVKLDLSQKKEINAILERNVTLHRLITTTIFSTMKTKGSPTSVTFFFGGNIIFFAQAVYFTSYKIVINISRTL